MITFRNVRDFHWRTTRDRDERWADEVKVDSEQVKHIWFVVDRSAFPVCDIVKRGKPGKPGKPKLARKGSKGIGGGGSTRGSSFAAKKQRKSSASNGKKNGGSGKGQPHLKRANTCKARIHHAK